jgi:tRNA(Met) cytidine acetyltransferase
MSQLMQHSHRQAVLLWGDLAWAVDQLDVKSLGHCFWYGGHAPASADAIAANHVTQKLGQQCDSLVVECHQGFKPDHLAALIGTLRGGGMLYLLLPNRQDFVERGLYEQRLATLFETEKQLISITQGDDQSPPSPVAIKKESFELTQGQQGAVEAIKRVATGHAKRPLVITADRGRGKTTALGEAIADLIEADDKKVIAVISMNRRSVDPLFDVLERRCLAKSAVQWMHPDEYVLQERSSSLCVIDEAAMVPLATLEKFLQRENRLVFSSTVHGYEGSGRGFVTRFTRLLDGYSNQVKKIQLDHPVRWADDDPLEITSYQWLMLNAKPDDIDKCAEVTIEHCDKTSLINDGALLRAIVGLLVDAHYQTRPSDLYALLNDPMQQLWLARESGRVVACAITVEEGGISKELAEQIAQGYRRPKGHLLLQSLAQHSAYAKGLEKKLWRIMRIATHEQCRRQGLASQLMQAILKEAKRQSSDLLGTSYAMDATSLKFWQSQDFKPARIGHRIDASSGAQSLQMLLAISENCVADIEQLHAQYLKDLPYRLSDDLSVLEPALVSALFFTQSAMGDIDQADKNLLIGFTEHRRELQSVIPTMQRVLIAKLSHARAEESTALSVAIKLLLQRQTYQQVTLSEGILKNEQNELLRQLFSELIANG